MVDSLTTSVGYDTDKEPATYLRLYDELFAPLRDRDIRLFELGIFHGGSLYLWRDYFPQGIIVGLDINQIPIDDPTGRIRAYQGLQQNTALLDRIAQETAPAGFDIIIDDASHYGDLTKLSFWHLFEHHLKPGGLYVIEDWGTGYWPTWKDGAAYVRPNEWRGQAAAYHAHTAGMVGFVHELVDECGMDDITHLRFGASPPRQSKFARMIVKHGQVVITKRAT